MLDTHGSRKDTVQSLNEEKKKLKILLQWLKEN